MDFFRLIMTLGPANGHINCFQIWRVVATSCWCLKHPIIHWNGTMIITPWKFSIIYKQTQEKRYTKGNPSILRKHTILFYQQQVRRQDWTLFSKLPMLGSISYPKTMGTSRDQIIPNMPLAAGCSFTFPKKHKIIWDPTKKHDLYIHVKLKLVKKNKS